MTHEVTLKSNEVVDERKRKIAFKTSSSQINEAMNDDEDSDEEMTLFTKQFNKIFKKGNFLEDMIEEILVEKKNHKRILSFASSARI